MSTLVIYFSQTGTTKAAAEKIAEMKEADLIEIRPEQPYNMSYMKTVFTSLKEIFTKARPELAMEIPDIQKYDRILVGCPIWCGVVPNVVLTLLDALNLSGKHIAVFTTSGATQPIKLAVKLKKSYPEAKWHKPLNANGVTEEEIRNWMQMHMRYKLKWDEKNFLVVPPNQCAVESYDEDVLTLMQKEGE